MANVVATVSHPLSRRERLFRFAVLCVAIVLTSAGQAPAADREPLYRGQTLDTWFRLLKEGGPDVRLQAVQAIGEFGPESRSRAKEFSAGLFDADRAVRKATAERLGSWEADAKDAAEVLAVAIRDTDPEVGVAASAALRQIGKVANDRARVEIVRALEDRDGDVRILASSAMSSVGWTAPAVAALADVMESKDREVRRAAIARVNWMESEQARPLRSKVYAQAFSDPEFAREYLGAVKNVGVDDTFLPHLTAALESRDYAVRIVAIDAAGMFPELAKPLASKVVAQLDSENIEVRRAAAMAAARLKQQDARAVAILAEMLEDRAERNEPHVSHGAVIEALGEMGPAAKDAVPQILRFLARTDVPFFRDEAERVGAAIGKIGPDAVKQLANLLGAKRRDLRLRTMNALYAMGSAAEAAVPRMAEFLLEADAFENVDEIARFTTTLGRLGDKAKPAAEALAQVTLEMDKELQEPNSGRNGYHEPIGIIQFAEAWWRIDADPRALSVLVMRLHKGNDLTRAHVAASIYHFVEQPPKSVFESLSSLLVNRTEEYATRHDGVIPPTYLGSDPQPPSPSATAEMAIYILSRLGNDSKPALGLFKRIAADDYEPDVVLAAAYSWYKLEPSEAPAKAAARCLTPELFPGQNPGFRDVTIRNTVLRLDEMGTHAKVVVPQLVAAHKQCTDADTKAVIAALVKKLDAEAAAKAGIE